MKYSDFKKNADKLRGYSTKKVKLTKEQKEFLLVCRDHDLPISYPKMAELWQEFGWGDMTISRLLRMYRKLKAGQIE